MFIDVTLIYSVKQCISATRMSDGDAKVQSNGPAAAAPAPAKEPPAAAKPAAPADDAAEPGPGAPRRVGKRLLIASNRKPNSMLKGNSNQSWDQGRNILMIFSLESIALVSSVNFTKKMYHLLYLRGVMGQESKRLNSECVVQTRGRPCSGPRVIF